MLFFLFPIYKNLYLKFQYSNRNTSYLYSMNECLYNFCISDWPIRFQREPCHRPQRPRARHKVESVQR